MLYFFQLGPFRLAAAHIGPKIQGVAFLVAFELLCIHAYALSAGSYIPSETTISLFCFLTPEVVIIESLFWQDYNLFTGKIQ
jgi:hypothetical protein